MGRLNPHIEKLRAGETVKFRPHGNSMQPRIESGQLVTLEPIGKTEIKVGDVVLCSVRGRQFLHLVTAIKDGRYQISNNKNHVNGWTGPSQVYGRLVLVEPLARSSSNGDK